MVKIVVYISDVVRHSERLELPKGLRQIAGTASSANRRHDITGLLCYKSGMYLQVIEGPAGSVDQLYANIKADSRHQNVRELLTVSARSRFFSDWKLHLMKGIRTDREFNTFVRHHREQLLALPIEHRDEFERFGAINTGVGSRGRYAGLDLWIDEWPDAEQFERTPAVTELCETLCAKRVPYEVLSSNHGFATEEELQACLDRLLKVKTLRLQKPLPPAPAPLARLKRHVARQIKDRMRLMSGAA